MGHALRVHGRVVRIARGHHLGCAFSDSRLQGPGYELQYTRWVEEHNGGAK